LAGIFGLVAGVLHDTQAYSGRVLPGISIAGAKVGGLTPDQAQDVAEAAAAAQLSRTVTIRIQDERFALTYGELGLISHVGEAVRDAYGIGRDEPWQQLVFTRMQLAWHPMNVPIRYSWNRGAVNKILAPLAAEINIEPQNAAVTVQNGKVVVTRESRSGRTLDLAATGARIRSALGTGRDEVAAVMRVRDPEFTSDAARALVAPLGQFTTKVPGTENRVHNVALAASYVSGTIVGPGGVFSYNQVVGPRTGARGFREAPILIDNELVQGDGGGVCQVSSTLFNVAVLADFQILARANHSRPVAYLPLGRDATVSYGAYDLQFKNTTGHHVLIWAWVTDRRLTVMAFGTPEPGKDVAIEVARSGDIAPPEGTRTKHDPELAEGKIVEREALPGYRAKTYRVVTVNGEVVRRELIGSSIYNAVARTIKIGTKKATQAEDDHS
ncbi:MAG TPA: VanW family protein, partial [bacterium]|nr:VanW family protein [bacterium]